MIVGICYIVQGITIMKLTNNKYTLKIGRSLLYIGIINIICFIIAMITKLIFIKSIGTLSIIIGLITLCNVTKELKKDQEEKILKEDAMRIIDKLSQ